MKQELKLFLFVVLSLVHTDVLVGTAFGNPTPPERYQSISGVVVEGIWVTGAPKLTMARISDDEVTPELDGVSDCWCLILKDIEGMREERRSVWSSVMMHHFRNSAIAWVSDGMARRIKDERLLVVAFSKPFDNQIRVGTKVRFDDVVIRGDERWTYITFSKLEKTGQRTTSTPAKPVSTKALELPVESGGLRPKEPETKPEKACPDNREEP